MSHGEVADLHVQVLAINVDLKRQVRVFPFVVVFSFISMIMNLMELLNLVVMVVTKEHIEQTMKTETGIVVDLGDVCVNRGIVNNLSSVGAVTGVEEAERHVVVMTTGERSVIRVVGPVAGTAP